MAVRPKTHADALAPAEPVPVAMLGRTSTLELQDPYGSITRQITSAREWLPDGFYIAGYYWDIESGGLALEERGHAGNYQPFVAKGLPRDGGLADLLAEARSANPRFAAVVCEDIERTGRDTFNALKLERELAGSDILLFATDEPIDLDGTDPATILLRRTRQNMAEYFRLQLKRSMWRGMRAHAEQGYNLGKVLDGYLPDKIPHPAPAKAAQGRTKTLLALDEVRAPIIAAIYADARLEKTGRADHPRPADRRPGHLPGRRSGDRLDARRDYSILGQPEIHRISGVRPQPERQARRRTSGTGPTSPPIRPSWTATPGRPPRRSGPSTAAHATGPHNPATWRTYPLRSRVRCKICKRRMCGQPKAHPDRKTPTEHIYYVCQFNPGTPVTSPPPPTTPAPSRSAKTS